MRLLRFSPIALALFAGCVPPVPDLAIEEAVDEEFFEEAAAPGEGVEVRIDLTEGRRWQETLDAEYNYAVEFAEADPSGYIQQPRRSFGLQAHITYEHEAQPPENEMRPVRTTVRDTRSNFLIGGRVAEEIWTNDIFFNERGSQTVNLFDRWARPEDHRVPELGALLSETEEDDDFIHDDIPCYPPDRPVSVGDAWGWRIVYPHTPEITHEVRHTLRAIEERDAGRVAVIDYAKTIEIPLSVRTDRVFQDVFDMLSRGWFIADVRIARFNLRHTATTEIWIDENRWGDVTDERLHFYQSLHIFAATHTGLTDEGHLIVQVSGRGSREIEPLD